MGSVVERTGRVLGGGWGLLLALPGRARGWAGGLREPVARRRFVIVLATVLVVAYALGVLGYVLTTPEIGVRCAFTPEVNYFYPEFLYPGGGPGPREGDRVVRVADQEVTNWWQHFLRKLQRLRRQTPEPVASLAVAGRHTFVLVEGQPLVRVEYERPGEEGRRTVWLRLARSPVETVVPSVLWFFLKIGLFVVGAMVFWKRPADRPAAQFFCLCIASFGAYMGGYHWARIVEQPVLMVVFMVCALLLPAVTLHFYLIFPRPKRLLERRPGWVLAGIYGPSLLLLLLLLSGYLRVLWMDGGWVAGGESAPEGNIDLIRAEILTEIHVSFGVSALLYVLSVVGLVHSYRTASTPTERNQVKWILFGGAAALVPIGYSLYLAFWEQGRFGGGAATWPMFAASALVTAAYTVSITRYRLMQLDQVVSSGMVYFLVSFLAGLLYYGLVLGGMVLVGTRVGETRWGQVLAASGTALVLMVALDLVRGRFKVALDRHFRREKHQLDRTLQRMSQAIEQLVDPLTLARRLLRTAAELLGAARGAVYLRQGDPALYGLAEALGPPPPLTELSPGCPLVEALHAGGTLATATSPGPAHRQLNLLGGEVAQALAHEGQLLGLLVLGPREGGAYTPEDVQLLAAFAQLTVPALVSAEGHRTIEGLNRDLKAKVEKIAEQQRRILALQSQLMSQRVKKPEEAPRPEEGAAAAQAPEPLAEGMVGSGPQAQELVELARRVAASSSAVLLRGESGTGKELLARALHENSPRAGKPFVKVLCSALSPGLLESELFGHVKGAFTSAIRDKVGRFEAAHGGTLFLDEIGDITPEVQTKLLRVLEEMVFERVGSSEPVQVDVRIVAATHQDLEALMRQGRFREDLFFRLNVISIRLPPLRERAEDVPELVQHFLRLFSQKCGKDVHAVDDDALAVLKGYHWPGNIRQLKTVIERAVVIADKPVVTPAELPPEVRASAGAPAAPEFDAPAGTDWPLGPVAGADLASALRADRADRERRERETLVRALAAAGGNKAEAARALGVARSTLVSRLKKYGLS